MGGDIAGFCWKEALSEDLSLLGDGVDQFALHVVEGWECINLLALLDFGKRPDIFGLSGMVEFVVGPLSLGLCQCLSEVSCYCLAEFPCWGKVCSSVGHGALIVPPVDALRVQSMAGFECLPAGICDSIIEVFDGIIEVS